MASRTLRPTATGANDGWTPSTGTLHGVLSDQSDATYASGTELSGSGAVAATASLTLDPSALDPADLSSAAGFTIGIRASGDSDFITVSVYSGSDLLGSLVVETLLSAEDLSESGLSQTGWPTGAKPDRIDIECTSGFFAQIQELWVVYEDAPVPVSTRRRRPSIGAIMAH